MVVFCSVRLKKSLQVAQRLLRLLKKYTVTKNKKERQMVIMSQEIIKKYFICIVKM